MTEKVYCVIIDYHETYANRNTFEIIGLYHTKKNAYKQAFLYEFEHNKKFIKNCQVFEDLLKNFDSNFEKDSEKFIHQWKHLREKCLNISMEISQGYRFNILETLIMD